MNPHKIAVYQSTPIAPAKRLFLIAFRHVVEECQHSRVFQTVNPALVFSSGMCTLTKRQLRVWYDDFCVQGAQGTQAAK